MVLKSTTALPIEQQLRRGSEEPFLTEGGAVEISHLRKEFLSGGETRVEVFRDFSLQIKTARTTVILGPSGCGKTTLLNILAGLEPVDGGTIGWAPALTKIGYMFQTNRLFPWRTALQNVHLGAELQRNGIDKSPETARSLLSTLGLGGFVNSYPNELSEGMRQRVALARTLLVKPDVLLLDEPFSSLDFESRLRIERLFLADSIARNSTTILVTHDLESALILGHEIVILAGSPAKVSETIQVEIPKTEDPFEARRSPDFYQILHHLADVTARWTA
jgi:NitT/TauT family transport system ATP-binding protein